MSDSHSRSHQAETSSPGTRNRMIGRTTLLLIPIHLAGFVVLYLGMMSIMRHEILKTHGAHARILLRESINDLHPAMECGDREQVLSSLRTIAEAHDLVSLRLYTADGKLIAGSAEPDESLEAFVAGHARDDYWFESADGALHMHGVQRIVARDDCTPCHEANASLGLAAIDVDLSEQYGATRSRLRLNLALLIAAWGIAIGVVNVITTRAARRSAARLQSPRVGSDTAPHVVSPMARAILDPVSRELLDSLQSVAEKQRQRDAEVVSKLHHTERLASLGRLTAGLAHEIKNPLAGVQGSLELLRDDAPDEDKRSLYQQMLVELRRVNDTIHSLLHFARPAPVRASATAVAEFLEETVQLLRPGFAKRGIRIETSVAPTVHEFCLDRAQIRQVLLNLVHNAADAIGENGRIVLQAATVPQHGGLLITVRDTGPGIAEEDLERVFEPFHTTKFAGTGLGLSVARSMVEGHGGELSVRSTPGDGAEFLIILPPPRSDSGKG